MYKPITRVINCRGGYVPVPFMVWQSRNFFFVQDQVTMQEVRKKYLKHKSTQPSKLHELPLHFLFKLKGCPFTLISYLLGFVLLFTSFYFTALLVDYFKQFLGRQHTGFQIKLFILQIFWTIHQIKQRIFQFFTVFLNNWIITTQNMTWWITNKTRSYRKTAKKYYESNKFQGNNWK